MSISKVFMICTAYEQGYRDGSSHSVKPKNNPYEQDTDLSEAYVIGFEAGRETVEEIKINRLR